MSEDKTPAGGAGDEARTEVVDVVQEPQTPGETEPASAPMAVELVEEEQLTDYLGIEAGAGGGGEAPLRLEPGDAEGRGSTDGSKDPAATEGAQSFYYQQQAKAAGADDDDDYDDEESVPLSPYAGTARTEFLVSPAVAPDDGMEAPSEVPLAASRRSVGAPRGREGVLAALPGSEHHEPVLGAEHSNPLEWFEASEEWNDEHVDYLAMNNGLPPQVFKVRVGRLLGKVARGSASAKDALRALHDQAAKAKWINRHVPREEFGDGKTRYDAWLAALEAKGTTDDTTRRDRDLLVFASAREMSLDAAMIEAGRILLDGGAAGVENLNKVLLEADEERLKASETARDAGLTGAEAELLGRFFELETVHWVTEDGVVVTGLSAADEAAVLVGRRFLRENKTSFRGRPKALKELLADARREEELLETWRGDANWAEPETELYASVLRREGSLKKNSSTDAYLRAVNPRGRALKSTGTRLAALHLGEIGSHGRGAKQAILREQRIRQWLREEERMLLLAAWNGAQEPRERVPRMLSEGRESELFALRARVVETARREAEDAFGPRGLFEGYSRAAVDLLAADWSESRKFGQEWDPQDISELLGASLLLSQMTAVTTDDWVRPTDIRDEFIALVREGRLPDAFNEAGWRLADVSELADEKKWAFRVALETVVVDLVTSEHSFDPAPYRAAREEAGLGLKACLDAFEASERWWCDDASFIADLRGVTQQSAEEWIGHRLLRGREDEIETTIIEDRIEEQSLFRTEAFDTPYVILVLQGGGAKAAYQVGVYEALEDAGLPPSWVLGISSGALNAATIVGNPATRRREQLHAMWDALTNKWEMSGMFPGSMSHLMKFAGAMSQLMYKPNFYFPHGLPNSMFPAGSDGAVSQFNNAPLRAMMSGVTDFSRVQREAIIHRRTRWSKRRSRTPPRLTVGTTHVRTGDFKWWDSSVDDLTVDHVMASGAMPPGAPAVTLEDELYWDGGVVGNNPLEPVLDDVLDGTLNGREVLVVFVDLWGSDEWLPRTKKEVELRQQQLDFVGRVDASIERFRLGLLLEIEKRRRRADPPLDPRPWRSTRRGFGSIAPKSLTILRVENGRSPALGMYDAMDFSASSLEERRANGYSDMEAALEGSDWRNVESSNIGGSIHYYRRGRLVSVTSAVNPEDGPTEV